MAFTDKGLQAITKIINDYTIGEIFTASDIGVHPSVLTSLAKEGYLVRRDTLPVSYYYTNEYLNQIKRDLPKSFSPYSEEEFLKQCDMSYTELIAYCNEKYGIVPGNYFSTPECKGHNHKIARGKEGLYIHHIKEDTLIMLSASAFAKDAPWEYQLGENLVYCNIFEHLLLHMRITESKTNCGIGGVINFILPELIEEYTVKETKDGISKKIFDKVMSKWLKTQRINNDLFSIYFDDCEYFSIFTKYFGSSINKTEKIKRRKRK